jgi:uncharacterized protein (DUF697 family)
MGVGAGSLKLANVWRVITEVDLDAIRREALAPFDLAIIGEATLAERIRGELSPVGAAPHRFIHVNPPGGAPTVPTAVILVTPPGAHSVDLDQTLRYLTSRNVPHALVVADVAGPLEPALSEAAGAIVRALPVEARLGFAHQLPAFRAPLYELVIEETARANASFAFTSGLAETVPILTLPLNLGDMVVLTKNQLLMGYRLVLASGRDGEPKRLIGELLGVLGGGLVFRQLARQLVGLIPVVGILPKVAVAYGGTWAIGRAVVLWVTEGRTATSETLRTFSREGLERGRAVARDISTRGRAGVAKASGRWDRLRSHVPGLRRKARAKAGGAQSAGPPPLPPPLPPAGP